MSFARMTILAAPLSMPLLVDMAKPDTAEPEPIEIELPHCATTVVLNTQAKGEGQLLITCSGEKGWSLSVPLEKIS